MYLRGFVRKNCRDLIKRIFIFALAMVFTCSSFDVVVLAEVIGEVSGKIMKDSVITEVDIDKTTLSGGSGTKEDPYKISTIDDLTGNFYDEDLYYVLTNDIYINVGNDYINDWSEMWDSNGSAGHIDGKGYTIYGLYNAPLFGAGGNSNRLYISNLNLKNVYYDTIDNGVGFSKTATLIENCSIQGTISTDEEGTIGCIGGYIGEVVNCKSDVNVHAPNSGVSGIAINADKVLHCYNYGSLCGKDVNGIMSYAGSGYDEESGEWRYCYNYGDLSGDYVNGIVSEIRHYRGAYQGDADESKKIYVENCFNYGMIKAEKEGNGICASIDICSENEEYVDELYINNCNNYGDVISKGNASGIIQNLYTSDYIIVMQENCNNYGAILGNVYTAGLIGCIHSYDNTNVQLYNCNNYGIIENIEIIENDYNNSSTGGIVGQIDSSDASNIKLYNCVNEGEVLAEQYPKYTYNIGGIIGEIDQEKAASISVLQCTNKGNVTSESEKYVRLGGIVGFSKGGAEVSGIQMVIEGCSNTGDFYGTGYVSGICGYILADYTDTPVEYNIRNCYNGGNINSTSSACGFTGGTGMITVENCYNAGSISGGSVYALTHHIDMPEDSSYNPLEDGGVIRNCYNVGKIYGEYGGIVSNHQNVDIGNIYTLKDACDSISSYVTALDEDQMKNHTNFIGFDFENVWEMDNGFYGYPVLQNNTHLSPLPDMTDTELSEDEVRVQVVNEKGHAIQDATVSIASTELTTDEKGVVTFSDITSETVSIIVEATGYPTKTETFTLEECNNLCKIVMSKRGLSSVTLSYNGKRYNLLLEEKKISSEYKDTKFTITCEATENIKDDVNVYKLIQEDAKAGTCSIVMSSTDGVFSLKTSDLSQGNAFYICGYDSIDSSKQLFKTQIHLNVIKPAKKIQKSQMDLGKDLAFTVDDDVPIFGGQKFSLKGITALPVYTEINDEKIKVGFNIDLNKFGEDEKTKEKKWQGLKETFSKSVKGNGKTFFDKVKKASEMLYVTPKAMQNPSVSIAVAGYAEAPVNGEKLTGKMYICLSASGSYESQIPDTPLVFSLDITGKVGGGGETTFYFTTSEFEGNCYADGSFSITIGLGVGWYNVASVGVYGKGELSTKYIIAPSRISGFEYWKTYGEIGVQLRLLGKESAKWRIIDGTYYLYRRDTSTIDKESVIASRDMMTVLTNSDLYTTIVHEQKKQEMAEAETTDISLESVSQNNIDVEERILAEAENGVSSSWVGTVAISMADIDTTFVEPDSYIDAKPQIIKVGDDILMLSLAANPARNAQNASSLVYSVYDKTNNQWSEPQAVADDGTADYNPVVYEGESGAYILWNNSNTVVADSADLSLTDTAADTDLFVMYYDSESDSFINGQSVKDIGLASEDIVSNDIYESHGAVYAKDNCIYYTWAQNSENDVFGLSGTNTICLAVEESGNMVQKELATLDKALIDLRIGIVNDEIYVAYSYDTDGDLSDLSDMKTYVQKVTDESTEAVLVYEGAVSDLQFSTYQTAKGLVWYSDGNYHMWDGTETQELLEEANLWGGNFSYFTDETDNSYITFSGNAETGTNRYLCTYNMESASWNAPVLMAESQNYIEQMDSIATNGNILSVYNLVNANMAEEEWVEGSNLGSLMTGEFCDLLITGVDYLAADFQKGAAFPATVFVANNGTAIINAVTAGLKDAEGLVVASVDIAEAIQPGETKELALELTLPSDVTSDTYCFYVENADGTVSERSTLDNTLEVKLGVTDLQTTAELYCLNGHYSVHTTVLNKGLDASNVTLNIKDYSTDEVYYTTSVEGLESGASYHLEMPLLNIGISETKENALYVEAISEDENEVEGNNIAYISIMPSSADTDDNGDDLGGGSSSGGSGESSGNISGGNANVSNPEASVVKVSEIKLTGISKKIAAGKKIKLSANVTPSNASNKAIKWMSSNKKYATVSSTGVVTVKKAGAGKTVKITATAQDGSGVKATYQIKIMKHKVTKVKLKASKSSVKAGKSVKIKATVKTNGKKVNKTLTWKSSNTKYATVTSKGVVKTKKAGKGKTVTITATSTDGTNKKAKVKIKIK
ncbi:MAG: Ig-like domain-containing protein [Lachnospiraceae bacterium]|nr:Ig-like domain-containing protein [Lachnospiraceae bacterium]